MKNLAIYGAGGFGREIACMINAINASDKIWDLIGFFDDVKLKGASNDYGIILGGIETLNSYDKPLDVIIAIASPKGLVRLLDQIDNDNISFPNVIAPDVRFTDRNSLQIGKGNIFSWGCCVTCNVNIGDFNAFNGFVTVGHDVTIGKYNSFMPGVRISGETSIGDRNYFGVGAAVLQKNKIGVDTVVGANSVIIRKTKDNMTYIGNPATIVKY